MPSDVLSQSKKGGALRAWDRRHRRSDLAKRLLHGLVGSLRLLGAWRPNSGVFGVVRDGEGGALGAVIHGVKGEKAHLDSVISLFVIHEFSVVTPTWGCETLVATSFNKHLFSSGCDMLG